MYYLKNSLQEQNHGYVIDGIDLYSFEYSLERQADEIFKILGDNGIKNRDKIVIIGHSQGGLRGYALYKKYNKDLNILGLFSLCSPWKGAGILDKIPSIKSKIEKYSDFIKDYFPEYYEYFPKILENLNELINKENSGVMDLKKESEFFKRMRNFKEHNDQEISIHNLYGGETDIFRSSLILYEGIQNIIEDNKELANGAIKKLELLSYFAILVDILTFFKPSIPSYISTFSDSAHLRIFLKRANSRTFRKECNYVLSFLNEFKELADINKKLFEYIGSDKHDGILSINEQIFDQLLKEDNMIINQFFIKDAYHGPVEYPKPQNISNIEKTRKAIYNHPETIRYINEKLRKIKKFNY